MINAFMVRKPKFIGHIITNLTNLSFDPNHNVYLFPFLNSLAWISANTKLSFAQANKKKVLSRFHPPSLSQSFHQDVFEQLFGSYR